MKSAVPILIGVGALAAVALASGKAGASSPSSVILGSKGPKDMLAELPPGVPHPKDRGAPFAPIPNHARFWPVPVQKRTVNYVSIDKGFQGYAAGNVFGAPRGSSATCTNGRKHCGIDLRGRWDDVLVSVGDGKIVGKQGWSGPNAKAILIALDDGPVLVYGAVKPNSMEEFKVDVGSVVKAGQPVCRVGRYPGGSEMLHFETYQQGTGRNAKWCSGSKPPSNLLDPSLFLLVLAARNPSNNV